jgi:hypothetical protein
MVGYKLIYSTHQLKKMKALNKIKIAGFSGLLIMTLASCIKDYDNPASGTTGEQVTLFALKQAYQGNEVTLGPSTLGGASKIQGVVISDHTGQNLEAGTFVLQQTILTPNNATDVTRGIMIRMNTGNAEYSFGDSLVIDITGTKLDRINGKLTISGMTADKITVAATNKVPFVRYVNQGILSVYMEECESTLIAMHADAVDYSVGATLSGLKELDDNTGPAVYLQTLTSAVFASQPLPLNAQFTGIAGYLNETGKDTAGAKKVIRLRTGADVQFSSGVLYAGFPESFESPDATTKASYNSGTNLINASTGTWYLLQAILANTPVSDKYNVPGKQAIRMQQNLTTSGYVQMNFEVPDGASKVTVFYGKYSTDAKSTFRLEYSVNGGTTWTAVGSNINDMPDKGNKQATWTMNITGPVRFRINKIGTGTSNNGRLALDDFAIYKKI